MMRRDIPLNERIIFALDFPRKQEAITWIKRLKKRIRFFKVGLELFLASGWDVVDFIVENNCKVMLDLKFFDIPQTVKKAVYQVSKRNVLFTTIHGNDAIIQAANEIKGKKLKVLAVTVLTSFDNTDMKNLGLNCQVEDMVFSRAKKAVELGCDGIVASAKEVKRLRQELGDSFYIVTPGIRPSSCEKDDQKRIATPYEAIKNGADYLVIGRPISQSHSPENMVDGIQEEIKKALDD